MLSPAPSMWCMHKCRESRRQHFVQAMGSYFGFFWKREHRADRRHSHLRMTAAGASNSGTDDVKLLGESHHVILHESQSSCAKCQTLCSALHVQA